MERLLAVSDAINAVLVKVAMAVGWLFLALTAVIVFDVLSRKFGFQIPEMGSTRLQELEWHLHTAIFTFWLGVGYIKNSHVRIDIALSGAKPRTLAITELLGCIIFVQTDYFSPAYSFLELLCHLRGRFLRSHR